MIAVIIECATCPVREQRCGDCMVTALLSPGAGLPLDDQEQQAVGLFVEAGLIGLERATGLRARTEPWAAHRAVG